jgi:hypothetical protein
MHTFTGLGDVLVAYPETDNVVRLTHPLVWAFARYCLAVKPEGNFARSEDFGLDALDRWRDHLMLVDYLAAEDDFSYRLYSEGIQAFTGFDMTGRRVSDFDSEVGRFFLRVYRQCIAEKRLIYSEHGYVHARRACDWYRVICPVQDGDRTYVAVCNYPVPKAAENAVALVQRRAMC